MAVGAELLIGHRHLGRALMLGMTFDAASGLDTEQPADDVFRPHHDPSGALGLGQLGGIGMVVDLGVAGHARGIAHRFAGLDVAGLAIVLEALVDLRQMTRGPQLVGVERDFAGLVGRLRMDRHKRPNQEDRDHQQRERPGERALARYGRGEREDMRLLLLLGSVGDRTDTLDGDDHRALVVAFAILEGQRMAADPDDRALRSAEPRVLGLFAINDEGHPRSRRDLDHATRFPDHGVVEHDRQVRQVDIAGRIAPDAQLGLVDLLGADDIPPIGGARYCANNEAHLRVLTNNRRRRRCARTVPRSARRSAVHGCTARSRAVP